MKAANSDNKYFEIFMQPIRLCARYRPKFGTGEGAGLTLEQFQTLYRGDIFYNWIGMDSPLIYAAHKAAGGMTSVYRQIGIGCQFLFRQILIDSIHLTPDQSVWSYEISIPGGGTRKLSLDGRIDIRHVSDSSFRGRLNKWISRMQDKLSLTEEARKGIKGVVFEVRQGYKSMDSKRQNADIANAASAYAHHYVPILVLLSSQIDQVLVQRYSGALWVLLRGTEGGADSESTYTFCREILGYDLAAFFKRNSAHIKREIEPVLAKLLTP